MAKYTGPKCKLCRREGEKLFLKGSRCLSDKCALTRRNQLPGQHGARRRRLSSYARHLREKQKVKRKYGIFEAQFRKYFDKAAKVRGVTGQFLLQTLERRLDNVVYVTGSGLSRSHARQLIRQGKVEVNGKVVTVPSYSVDKGDVISVGGVQSVPRPEADIPSWIRFNKAKKSFKITRFPEREDIDSEINEQLIVEFYSR